VPFGKQCYEHLFDNLLLTHDSFADLAPQISGKLADVVGQCISPGPDPSAKLVMAWCLALLNSQ
jgi:hypothetical protein